jgi:prephenate dehydrogenase
MNHITIIGCGLIGGSIAALIKKHLPNTHVHGIDPSQDSLNNALNQHLIQSSATSINEADINEVIIITSPIDTIAATIQTLNQIQTKTFTIIECSSVKAFLKQLPDSPHRIVPIHPMGGSDKQGMEHASANLLANCPLITFPDTPQSVTDLCVQLSFNIIACDSLDTHDAWMAHISHGPYILASLLPSILSNTDQGYQTQLSNICADGFKDTTRVANSPVPWGSSVLFQNKDNILTLIQALRTQLDTIHTILSNNQQDALNTLLSKAKNTRNSITDNAQTPNH